jgi:hypothetical protein
MAKKKTSIIWQISDKEFINLVKTSKTMSAVLYYFGMENKGNNYHTCKTRINKLNLDTSHFLSRVESSTLKRKMTLDEFNKKLILHSQISRAMLKKYLIQFNLLEYRCSNCRNCGEWDNKKLTLQLEHKNGHSNDNRLENLTFLCPNCHSQTSTYAGKKLKIKYYCKHCNNEVSCWSKQGNGLCYSCSGIKNRKVIRPSKEILEKEVLETPMEKLGLKYGVSGNAIKKWCIAYQINLPNFGRGFWTKHYGQHDFN